jgi:glycerol uptake facilitator-like aquaporin
MHPLLALLLTFIDAVFMLGGAGQLGRWAYLWVFMSVPIAGSIWLVSCVDFA